MCGKVWEIRLADCCSKLLCAPWSIYYFQPSKLVRVGYLFGLWLRYRSNLQQYNEGFGQRRGNEETHRYRKMQTRGIKKGLRVTFYRNWTDTSNPTIKEYFKGTFKGLSCEPVSLFLSAGAHRNIFICEIRISKEFCVHQPATVATAGLLTQAFEGCKLYSITSDLGVHAQELAEGKKNEFEGKKKKTFNWGLSGEMCVTFFMYFWRWLFRVSNKAHKCAQRRIIKWSARLYSLLRSRHRREGRNLFITGISRNSHGQGGSAQ